MAFEIQLQLLSVTDKRRAQKARQKFNYCDGCGLRAQLAKTFHIVTEKSSAARIPSTQHLPTAKVALENELLKAFYGRPTNRSVRQCDALCAGGRLCSAYFECTLFEGSKLGIIVRMLSR